MQTVELPKVTQVKRIEIGFRTNERRSGQTDYTDFSESDILLHEAQMLTGDENVVNCSMSVQYRITNSADYLFNFDDEGEVTATRCAEATGESVASCSFHLRMLAKYGFVEPAERRGKEKPWRAVGQGRQLRFDPEVSGSLPAAGAVAALMVDQEAARLRDWLARASSEDPAWLLASTQSPCSFA